MTYRPSVCPFCGVEPLESLSTGYTDPDGQRTYDCGTVAMEHGAVLRGRDCITDQEAAR